MQYNLVRNGSLQALTSSGTGDISLTYSELEALQNQNFTSSGVEITNSGILYLEVDLSQRIKIDGIQLYADDLSKSSNIEFAYRNTVTGTYTVLNTVSGTYYSASTITDPSAPRFVRAVISGTNMEIYEFQVFNDDYIVAFGEDGQLFAEYLSDTPVGTTGDAEAIALYNNGTSNIPADAYTVIDLTGNDGDNYVEISTNITSGYVSINDGVLIEDDDVGSTWKWSDGTFSNTEVSADSVVVTPPAINYTTPSTFVNILFNSYSVPSCGFNTLLYNPDDDVVYLVARDGSPLKLWEFDYKNDSVTLVSELKSGYGHQYNVAVATYLDGYVYAISRVDVDTYAGAFFRYDVNGFQDNYEDLPSPPTFSGGFNNEADRDRISMCSDGERYIYLATVNWGDTNSTTGRNFIRYDTTTSGWTVLSDQYRNWYHSSPSPDRPAHQTMTYDTDRGIIYMLSCNTNFFNWTSPYLQRYFVNTDTWDNWYVRLDENGGIGVMDDAGTSRETFTGGYFYHDDWIYFGPEWQNARYTIIRYNVATTAVESIYIGYRDYGGNYRHHEGHSSLAFTSGGVTYNMLTNLDGHRNQIFTTPLPPAQTISLNDGTYTTPIFKLTDRYRSSYFITDGEADPDSASISYDPDVYNGTIRVKNSDTAPLTVDEVYYPYYRREVGRWVPYTNNLTEPWKQAPPPWNEVYLGSYATAVDRRTGNIAHSILRSEGTGGQMSAVYIYNRSGSVLYSALLTSDNYWTYAFNTFMQMDFNGGIWGYGDFSGSNNDRHLIHFGSNLSVLADVYTGSDFFYFGVADLDGDGLWYTHQEDNILYHLSWNGTVTHTIPLPEPRWLCGTLDNGCWVNDTSLDQLLRYDSDGLLVKTVDISGTSEDDVIDGMCHDFNNGVWFRINNNIFHMTSAGVIDIGPVFINAPSRMEPSHNGVYVTKNASPDTMYFINNSGVIEKTVSINSSSGGVFGVLSYNYDDFVEFKTTGILPVSYDPVWGTGGSAEWLEVRKDGYFLPKKTYHISEITLRGDAELTKVIMAPAIKTEDIPPEQYKNIYVRSNIPEVAGLGDYSTRLKTWWGLEE